MKQMIIKGKNDAIVVTHDSALTYEIVVAHNYDENSETWGQGHYFTLYGKEVTTGNKVDLLADALNFWKENGYF